MLRRESPLAGEAACVGWSRAIVESVAIRDRVATQRYDATGSVPELPGQGRTSARCRVLGGSNDAVAFSWRQGGELAHQVCSKIARSSFDDASTSCAVRGVARSGNAQDSARGPETDFTPNALSRHANCQ